MPWNRNKNVPALLQISDPHFGTERLPVVEALLDFARALAPELVVLSGDITQRATRRQFEAARSFCAQLAPVPVLAIPGNHDVPLYNLFARCLAPYSRYREAFGPVLEPLHNSADWLVIGVNTTRRWRHKHGQVSARQIEQVAQHLRRAQPAQMRVVVVHQPVAAPGTGDAHNLLRGREAAIRGWAEAGADVVAGGHIHLPCVLPLHDLHAGLAQPLWCVQAGTSMSSRVRGNTGNSVNVLRHHASTGSGGQRHATVERWDYQATRHCFALAQEHTLPLASGAAHE